MLKKVQKLNSKMINIFQEIQDEIFFNEDIILNELKIKEFILKYLIKKLESAEEKQRPFLFQDIIYNFFEYLNIKLIRSKKTRDSGIDGIINLDIDYLGKINIGLQIKYTKIDSNDIDAFVSSLKNAELILGAIICKESRKFDKYSLNNKLKTILMTRGIETKEEILKEEININPIFILTLNDVLDIISSNIGAMARGVYKA